MSLFLDIVYINQIAYKLDRFHWQRSDLANFRCPHCGDSQKTTSKRRGYFFPDHDSDCMRFKCHNCNEFSGWEFGYWLCKFDHSVYQEYQLERFKARGGLKQESNEWLRNVCKPVKTAGVNIRRVTAGRTTSVLPESLIMHSTRLNNLDEMHEAKLYAIDRCFTDEMMNLFSYVDNYREFLAQIGITDPELLLKAPRDRRIIIPIISESMALIGVQGRALDPDAGLRYATNKLLPDFPKTFGLHRIDHKKTRIVVEGPIDSMFLPNCLASADADLLKVDGDIYIPDNQYLNSQICDIVMKIIDAGKRVTLFPDELREYKDINDMVRYGNMSIRDIVTVIAKNTYSGLRAKMVWATIRHV